MIYPPPAPNEFALCFYAQAGSNYTVQFVNDPRSTNWQPLTNFPGTGADTVVIDYGLGASRRFYRVLMQ